MKDTRFRPSPSQASRIAFTSASQANGQTSALVNDPTAQRMGGVAGHSGTLLDCRRSGNLCNDAARRRNLSRLGWDLAEPIVSGGDGELSVPSYGHTGFTGTMLWIDPVSGTYVIVLSNRTYPNTRGDAHPLRNAILDRVSASLRHTAIIGNVS